MILYHFPTSPFSRRVRLALSLKGLSAELRDARANPEHLATLRTLNPTHTVPVLVDGTRVIPDSTAICHYLDRKAPDPQLWPSGLEGAEAFEFMALADSAIGTLVDLGLRYSSLHDHAGFPAVRAELVGRAQRALDRLAEKVSGRGAGGLCGNQWSGADMAVYTLVIWLERMPARAETFPPAKTMLGLGWSLPVALGAWADQHRNRADVLTLD